MADAMPLAAAATARIVTPITSGRLYARQPEPELLPFAIPLRAPSPAIGPDEASWRPTPATSPVERMLAPRINKDCLTAPHEDPELPVFALALCLPAPADSRMFEEWCALPAASPVERVVAARAAALFAWPQHTALRPNLDCLAMADPASSIAFDSSRTIPHPQMVKPVLSASGPVHNIPILDPAPLQPECHGYFPDGPEREAPVLPEAMSARSLATPVSGRVPAAQPMRLPRIGGGPMPNQGLPSAPFFNPAAPPAEETHMPRHIPQAPVSTISIRHPKSPDPVKFAVLAMADLMPLEYFCSRGPRVHPHGVGWMIPSPSAAAPRFNSQLLVERHEAPPPVPITRGKRPSFAEIFSLPEAAGLRSRNVGDWSKVIAACLVLGVGLWLASGFLRSNHDSGSGPALTAEDSGALVTDAVSGNHSGGVFHRVRTAIALRAEMHLNDGFQSGMAAWGAPSQSWAPGWVRHPAEGYVTPGKLALYRPSLRYSDYRLEFFGQVDQKSLDWAVRASDDANYYAMKFAADGPGPRAHVSMIHYPVINGQKGDRVVTPVSAMIHEHTPYHIEVDVAGDRITTAIEGEQVDTFVAGNLSRGGVGFFADAGEQARLYWVRVSGNEDWVGRVCAFLSGGKSTTAQLSLPAGAGRDNGAPLPTNHLVMAAGFSLLRRRANIGNLNRRGGSSWPS